MLSIIIYFNDVLEGDDRNRSDFDFYESSFETYLFVKEYLSQPPTEACTFFGKNAISGEDGFGKEYKYDLSFQGNVRIYWYIYIYKYSGSHKTGTPKK